MPHPGTSPLFGRLTRLLLGLGALAATSLLPPALLGPHLPGAAHAQPVQATVAFTLSDVRPEALSWYWDNVDAAFFTSAHRDNQAFEWLDPPGSPQHLGYSAGARYRSVETFAGKRRTVQVSYLAPELVRGRVASDNYLGDKPYSFIAQHVSIDGRPPFLLLVQYTPTGRAFGDTQVSIETSLAADPLLAAAYARQVAQTLKGLQPRLMQALDERYFTGVLKTRGRYTIGPVDKNLNVKLTIVQEIRGITTEMLAWWWDHIGNTERYRLWQPIDHVSFEWRTPPNSPDLHYDVGAKQRVKEYVGSVAFLLDITGADPVATPPPDPITQPDFFYARTDLTLLAGLLPSNSLVHEWKPNASGDGVILTSTFVNTALANILNPTFFNDLGTHALREFQMLPYFLPRLYRREHLHQ